MANATKILLVDDESAIQRVVSRFLEPGGITVVSATTCAQARDSLDRHEFSLILLDINLPDCSGLDFCEEICRNRRVPVVMLTVSAEEEDVVRALDAGADDYLRKPFGGRELRARVERVLRRVAGPEDPLASTIEVGVLSLDPRNYRVTEYARGRLSVAHRWLAIADESRHVPSNKSWAFRVS